MLSDGRIRELIESGELGVEGIENLEQQLSSSTLDLRVGADYKRPATDEVFSAGSNDGNIILEPNTFYHMHTMEEIYMPDNIHGSTEEVMSLALDGIRVSTGAVHPGYDKGYLVLAVENRSETSKMLKPGDSIVQVTFHQLESPVEETYEGENRSI
jgi:deoxycytidine triphosphate deaminase